MKDNKAFKAKGFVSTYALSHGIIEVEISKADIKVPSIVFVKRTSENRPRGWFTLGDNIHLERCDAVKKAEANRMKAIEECRLELQHKTDHLNKKIERLESLKFE